MLLLSIFKKMNIEYIKLKKLVEISFVSSIIIINRSDKDETAVFCAYIAPVIIIIRMSMNMNIEHYFTQKSQNMCIVTC